MSEELGPGAGKGGQRAVAWIVWYAALLHLVWAVALLFGGSARNVTAIHGLTKITDSPWLLALFLSACSIAALWGLIRREDSRLGVVAIFPQQILLLLSGFSAIEAMWLSEFADGVTRPRSFIIADQFPALLLAAMHTLVFLRVRLPGGRVR